MMIIMNNDQFEKQRDNIFGHIAQPYIKSLLGVKIGLSTIPHTVAIEPRAMAIKHTIITGIGVADTEHQISLYADDVMLSYQ